MITGRQIRHARKLLGWNVAALSGMAELDASIIERAEQSKGTPSMTLAQARRIEQAFAAVGVSFGQHGGVAMHREAAMP